MLSEQQIDKIAETLEPLGYDLNDYGKSTAEGYTYLEFYANFNDTPNGLHIHLKNDGSGFYSTLAVSNGKLCTRTSEVMLFADMLEALK